jgi:hypothetical protein
VGFISLCCPKSIVDSEGMMGLLDRPNVTPHKSQAHLFWTSGRFALRYFHCQAG